VLAGEYLAAFHQAHFESNSVPRSAGHTRCC
jgi:hypothetical protein